MSHIAITASIDVNGTALVDPVEKTTALIMQSTVKRKPGNPSAVTIVVRCQKVPPNIL
jgi:hypothetical protein